MSNLPYWRLSYFYFFYFAALGALVPYWALYLQDLDFDPIAIGELMAILMGTKIVAPFVWGWLGDRMGRRMSIVRSASLVAMLVFISVYWVETFWPMALVMVLYSFFWNASLPQFEAVTFGYLGDRARHYARVRVWGSVGFIATVMLLGVLVDVQGTRVILHAVLLLYIGIWLSTLWVRDPPGAPMPAQQPSLMSILQQPSIVAFFVAVLLMQMSHGPYYTFFSIHMEQQGHSKALIGQLWALGVGAEVLLFIVMHRVLHRWGGRRVLIGSLLIAAVRWVCVGWLPDSLGWMLFAQCLHAATFGAFHASAIYLVHHYFMGRHQGRGQALYSSLSFGAGGAAGSLLSGYVWQPLGPAATYSIAAAVAVLGAIVAWRGMDALSGTHQGFRATPTGQRASAIFSHDNDAASPCFPPFKGVPQPSKSIAPIDLHSFGSKDDQSTSMSVGSTKAFPEISPPIMIPFLPEKAGLKPPSTRALTRS